MLSQLTKKVQHKGCNTGIDGLHDVYTLSPWAWSVGIHIYQAIRQTILDLACVTVQLLPLTGSATVTCDYLCIMATQHV